ncbi:MAG: phosphate ABC transporter permease PstA [Dehalococcoidia bacterium]|nr:phosphate ABC transporter permease PstA [Dehalococcoidia bacterium]
MSAAPRTVMVASGRERRNALLQSAVFALTFLATVVVIAPIVVVSAYVLREGVSAITLEFLLEGPRRDGREGGIFPVIVLTGYTLVLVVLMAVPVGVASAVFLSEYARPGRLLRLINLTIINLAGVPSIVYGLFGAALFLDILGASKALWVVAATLALQALAIIITSARESLLSVPQGIREGSLALGVSKLRTTAFVTLPQALPGIVTGVLLAISRAAGETAPVLVVGAIIAKNVDLAPSAVVNERAQSLSFELYGRIVQGIGYPEERKWGIALVLLAFVLVFNLSALFLRGRIASIGSVRRN